MTITDFTTATPREIDTELAEIYGRIYKAQDKRDNQWEHVLRAVRTYLKLGYRDADPTKQQVRDVLSEAYETIEAGLDKGAAYGSPEYQSRGLVKAHDEYQALCEAVDELWFEAAPYTEQYDQRRWTRAFLVDNTNGHVHKNMHCSTCFPTTRYCWLPEYSGGTENAIVQDAGERACTVCYPSAPVDVLKRATKIFSEAEKDAQKAREERAAAKIAREAKRLEKAILPDGSELVWPTYRYSNGNVGYDRTSTLVTARSRLTDLVDGYYTNEFTEQATQILSAAIAFKEGKDIDQVLAEAKTRAAKRK